MHAIFMPYGIKDCVDDLVRDMQAQKFPMKCTSPDGQQTKSVVIQGSLRFLPMGVYDYVFPKEHVANVLTELRFNPSKNPNTKGKRHNYNYISPFKVNVLRKMLKAEKIPEFQVTKNLFWMTDNVSIIPIGIREDGEVAEPAGALLAGWTHEAI